MSSSRLHTGLSCDLDLYLPSGGLVWLEKPYLVLAATHLIRCRLEFTGFGSSKGWGKASLSHSLSHAFIQSLSILVSSALLDSLASHRYVL